MQRFTDLKVWQRSHALALEIYRVTAAFPEDERFGLGLPAPAGRGLLCRATSRRGPSGSAPRTMPASSTSPRALWLSTEYLLILSADLGYRARDRGRSNSRGRRRRSPACSTPCARRSKAPRDATRGLVTFDFRL